LLQTNGKQIQSIFKALDNCSDEIHLCRALVSDRGLYLSPSHPVRFLVKKSLFPHLFNFSFPADCIRALSWWYPTFLCQISTLENIAYAVRYVKLPLQHKVKIQNLLQPVEIFPLILLW